MKDCKEDIFAVVGPGLYLLVTVCFLTHCSDEVGDVFTLVTFALNLFCLRILQDFSSVEISHYKNHSSRNSNP